MSSPRVVELERQLERIEKAIDAAAGDRVSEVWLAQSINSSNRPGHDLWLHWLNETGLTCGELKLWLHRLPEDIPILSTPNYDGVLGDGWVLVEVPSRVTEGPSAYSWFSPNLYQHYQQWRRNQLR